MDEQAEVLSVFGLKFWDLWFQKCFRNVASLKCQWLVALYIPIIWGMFNYPPGGKEPWISAVVGLGFLGGGFLTLALGRIAANTSLTKDDDPAVLNTDK
jgi:hypothetical protein